MTKKTGIKTVKGQLTDGKSINQNHNWVLPEECPIAIRLNGETYAIMLATPLDLIDFARGFCLSEGLVKHDDAIISITEKLIKNGIEVNVTLTDDALDRFKIMDKRRNLAGASGCGVCGLTSISHIVEALPKITSDMQISIASVIKAKHTLRNHTPLNQTSFSVHGAAFCDVNGAIVLTREDVGRHNALDKLIGAIHNEQIDITAGFILLTCRFAYELAQKSIRMGVPMVVSISAPTTMAIDMAKAANLTYAAFDKNDDLMILSVPRRLV